LARILIAKEGHWYDELRAVAYYVESEIEKWILQHAQSLFPGYFVFPFKIDIVSRTKGLKKRADLALVRKDFSAWTVVEVELREHSKSHVLEQAAVLADGDYNPPEMAEYVRGQLRKFCGKRTSLDRLQKLFSGQTPSILVIADAHRADLQAQLSATGVDFGVFEVYKSVSGQYVYRSFGQYPAVPDREAHCRPHVALPNVIEVIGNFVFGRSGSIEVIYDGFLTRWSLFTDGGKQYLRFLGLSNPLSPNASYVLFSDKARRYFFRRS
jgi:hypothetical protein